MINNKNNKQHIYNRGGNAHILLAKNGGYLLILKFVAPHQRYGGGGGAHGDRDPIVVARTPVEIAAVQRS